MTLDPVSTLLLDEAGLGAPPPDAPSSVIPGVTRDLSTDQSAVDAVEPTETVAEPQSTVTPDLIRGLRRDRWIQAEVARNERVSKPRPTILVIDDPALATHLHASGHDVRAYCDDLQDERLLPFIGLDALDATTLAEVELVLLRLPKSLGMLEDYAQRVAAFARPDVRLLAGGRQKHLTRSMNEVLASSFNAVRASLGRQKSRILHATEPKPAALTWPRTTHLADLDLTVVSHAGVFAADKLDGGTRLLLAALDELLPRTRSETQPDTTPTTRPDLSPRTRSETQPDTTPTTPPELSPQTRSGVSAGRAVDLGCGTGILAACLAQRGYDVLAVDTSRAACASARDTAAANSVTIEVLRADGLRNHPASIDLVVCNPPFHRGTTKDSTPGFDLLRSAIPALAPDAEVWTVFNSHLPYLPFLRREIGPTQVVARDRNYTVTQSRFSTAPEPESITTSPRT